MSQSERREALLLLAAGRGTRLGQLTAETPKPLLEIAGEPIAAHTLRLAARHGIRRVIINIHHLAGQIRSALGDGSRFGVDIEYLEEEALTGTAGPLIALAGELAEVDDVLVIYGDLVLDFDFDKMRAFHRDVAADITVMVHERARSNSVVVVDQEMRVTRFLERPTDEERSGVTSRWVNSGVQLIGRAARARLPDTVPCDLPADLYMPNVDELRIFAHPLDGYRVAIDSPERLALARETFRPANIS